MFNPQILKMQADIICRTSNMTSNKKMTPGRVPQNIEHIHKAQTKLEKANATPVTHTPPIPAMMKLKQKQNEVYANNLKMLQYTLTNLPTLNEKKPAGKY